MFMVMTFSEYRLTESYVPIYQQCIEQSWIQMMNLARCTSPENWIMIKTDELVIDKSAPLDEEMLAEVSFKYEEITDEKI